MPLWVIATPATADNGQLTCWCRNMALGRLAVTIALADCHHAQSVVSHTHKLTMTDIDHRCHSLAMSWWVYSHTLDMQMLWRDTNGHLVFACACSYVRLSICLISQSRESRERGKKSTQLDTHSLPIRCLFRISASLHTLLILFRLWLSSMFHSLLKSR